MKKLLSLALMAMMVMPLFAGSDPKNWDFSINENGECIVERSFDTDKDAAAALNAVKMGLNTQVFTFFLPLNEAESEQFYQIKKNTQTRYNPFAGMFQEYMEFKLKATYESGKVNVLITDLSLQKLYAGYGAKMDSQAFPGVITDYDNTLQTAATLKGKAKKEALEHAEDINGSLNSCQEELNIILNAIGAQL